MDYKTRIDKTLTINEQGDYQDVEGIMIASASNDAIANALAKIASNDLTEAARALGPKAEGIEYENGKIPVSVENKAGMWYFVIGLGPIRNREEEMRKQEFYRLLVARLGGVLQLGESTINVRWSFQAR